MCDVVATDRSGARGALKVELTVSAAHHQLTDLVNRAGYGGDTIFLTRRGRRLVVLGPVTRPDA